MTEPLPINSSVMVALRVRPLNERELELSGGTTCVTVTDRTAVIHQDQSRHTYTFDRCFPDTSTQEEVYGYIAPLMLPNLWEGYNCCLFAYGQTGSGKTHTMMGHTNTERGILPRLCSDIFAMIHQKQESNPGTSFRVEASYYEIYCEKIRDLLRPENQNLKVRQHPVHGVFVGELSSHVIPDWKSAEDLLRQGTSVRATAETKLNDRSSRSHAIFTLNVTVGTLESQGETITRYSKMHVVDLAGSERVGISGVEGTRFEEAKNINLSLTTLGRVIDVLVEISQSRKKSNAVPPYRESTLTHLLQDSLGGNSKTVMIATISPSVINYEESKGSLRYASTARNIINVAVINEQENSKLTTQLRLQLQRLTQQLENETRKVQRLLSIETEYIRLKSEADSKRIEEQSRGYLAQKELLNEKQKIKGIEARYQKCIEDRDRRINELQQLVQSKHTETDTMIRRHSSVESEHLAKYMAITESHRAVESENVYMKDVIKDLRQECDTLRRTVEECERHRLEIETEQAQKSSRYSVLERHVEDAEITLHTKIQQLDETTAELNAMKGNYGRLAAQHALLKSLECEWRQNVDSATAERDELKYQLQVASKQLEEFKSQTNKAAIHYKMLEDESKEQRKSAKDSMEVMKARETALLQQLEEARSKVSQSEQSLKTKVLTLQSDLERVIQEKSNVERNYSHELNVVKADLAQESKLNAMLTTEIQQMRNELSTVKENTQRTLTEEITKRNAEIVHHDEVLAQFRQNYSKEVTDMQTQVSSVRNENEVLRVTVEALEQEIKGLLAEREELDGLRENVMVLTQEATMHETQTMRQQEIIEGLQREIELNQEKQMTVHYDTTVGVVQTVMQEERFSRDYLEHTAFDSFGALFEAFQESLGGLTSLYLRTQRLELEKCELVAEHQRLSQQNDVRIKATEETFAQKELGKEKEVDRLREKEKRWEETQRELNSEILNLRDSLLSAERRATRSSEQENITQRMCQSTVDQHKQEEVKLRAEKEIWKQKCEDLQKKYLRESQEAAQQRARWQQDQEKHSQRIAGAMEEHTKTKQRLLQENESLKRSLQTAEAEKLDVNRQLRESAAKVCSLEQDLREAQQEIKSCRLRIDHFESASRSNLTVTDDLHKRCEQLLRDNKRLADELKRVRTMEQGHRTERIHRNYLTPAADANTSNDMIGVERGELLLLTPGYEVDENFNGATTDVLAKAMAANTEANTTLSTLRRTKELYFTQRATIESQAQDIANHVSKFPELMTKK